MWSIQVQAPLLYALCPGLKLPYCTAQVPSEVTSEHPVPPGIGPKQNPNFLIMRKNIVYFLNKIKKTYGFFLLICMFVCVRVSLMSYGKSPCSPGLWWGGFLKHRHCGHYKSPNLTSFLIWQTYGHSLWCSRVTKRCICISMSWTYIWMVMDVSQNHCDDYFVNYIYWSGYFTVLTNIALHLKLGRCSTSIILQFKKACTVTLKEAVLMTIEAKNQYQLMGA